MARILYAVQGEGMGHATRSKVVIEHLKKQKHKVIIAAGGKAYKFLSKNFSNVHNISSHHIVYENNEVKNIKTAFEYFRNLPSAVINNFKQLLKILLIFEPELVITDFEPFSNFISNRFKIPVLAIDNISIILKGSIKVPANEIFSFLTAAMVTQAFVRINADKYIITTFFYPKVKKPDNTILVPPALRNEILNAKQKKGNHILVYQTSITNKELLKTMKKVNEKFIIYGLDKEKTDKKIVFR
ncbi:teichoic acid biosynthesis protein, partial [Candidatus Woesearchaeota archaeon]|nr:teichoic acid biosynthesis protein [Candidatus Woesearchaeota archaeon]